MKKNITAVILAVSLLIAMLPMQASAAGTEGDRLVLEAEEGTLVVRLVLPNAAEEKLSSLQLSLTLDAGEFSEFTFEQEVTGKAKVYEAYYGNNRRQVNLYIAGTEPLYTGGNDTLTIGSAVVQSKGSSSVNATGKNVKIVRGTVLEDKDLSDSVSISPGTNQPGSNQPGSDTGNGNTGNGNTGNGNTGSYYPGNSYPVNTNPGNNQSGNNQSGDDGKQPSTEPEEPTVPPEPVSPSEPDLPSEPSAETVISKPELLKAQNTAAGVTVKWTKASNASGYYVYRKSEGGRWKRIAAVKGGNKTGYTDKTVKSKNGKMYIYTVKAYNGENVSTYSRGGLKIYCLTAPALSRPVSKSAGEIQVNWKQNKKADGYQVQYARSADFQKQKVTKTVKTAVTKKITKLKQKKTYYVRVRSCKKTGGVVYYSAWSKGAAVRTK